VNEIIITSLVVVGLGLAFAILVLKLSWRQIGRTLITVGFTFIGVAMALFLSVGPTPMDTVKALVIAGVLIIVFFAGVAFLVDAVEHSNNVHRQRAEEKRNKLLYQR